MKKLLLTLLLVPALSPLMAQNSTIFMSNASHGYYIKDGVVHYAYISTENEDLQATRLYIPLQQGHNETIFTPDQITEYGLTDGGKRFHSVSIDGEWLFMEELQKVDNNTSILFLAHRNVRNDAYYLSENGISRKIATGNEPRPMWDYLSSLNDCSGSWSKSVRFPKRLRSETLSRYYGAFAHCNEKLFPRNRFGITVSGGMGSPNVQDSRVADEIYTKMEYRYAFSFSAGLFFRFPFDEVSSFQPEVSYFRQSVTGTREGRRNPNIHLDSAPGEVRDIKLEASTVRVPLLFRFNNNYARGKIMPYAEIGPLLDFNFGYYAYDEIGAEERQLPQFAAGVAAGIGAEYHINSRHTAYLGFRFNYVTNLERTRKYNVATYELVAGFSLFAF